MSGHNPHSRLGQSSNQTWNHLQVPAYMPRQPQVAHMSNERPIVQPAMSWHTPTHTEAALYNYMAAATHKTPLDINPLLPAFVRPSAPFGSVDLSLSRHSTTPSPRNITSSPLISSTPPPTPTSQQQQQQSLSNQADATNNPDNSNKSSNSGSGVIQSTGNTKDILTNNLNGDTGASGNTLITLPPPQGSTLSTGGPPTLPGGLFIRDARQINDEIAKQVSKELLQKSQNEMSTMSAESRESLQFATDNIFQNFSKIVNQHHHHQQQQQQQQHHHQQQQQQQQHHHQQQQQLQLKEALERDNYSLQPPPPQQQLSSSSSLIPTITSTISQSSSSSSLMSMNQQQNIPNLKPKTPEPKIQLLTNPLTMPPRQTIHPLLKSSTIQQSANIDHLTSESSQLNFVSPIKSTSSVILHSQSSSSSTCSSSSSISPLTELGNQSSTSIIDDNNLDTQTNKQRRRRKPNKTIKMSNNEIEPTKSSTDLTTILPLPPLPLPLPPTTSTTTTTISPPVLNNHAQLTNQINSTLPITISTTTASVVCSTTSTVTASSNLTITTTTTTPAAAAAATDRTTTIAQTSTSTLPPPPPPPRDSVASIDEIDRPAVIEPICVEKRVYLTTNPTTNDKQTVDNLEKSNITKENNKQLEPKVNLNKLSPSKNTTNDNNLMETNKNNDDYETIDKIAEMIANTAAKTNTNTNKLILPSNKIISQPIISIVPVVVIDDDDDDDDDNDNDDQNNKSTKKLLNPIESTKLTNIVEKNTTATGADGGEPIIIDQSNNSSYEELENKLEEMFAGIEDDRPTTSINPSQVSDNKTKNDQQNNLTIDKTTIPLPSTSNGGGGGRNIITKTSTPTIKTNTVVRKTGGGGGNRSKLTNSKKKKRGKTNVKSRSKPAALNKASTTDYVPTNGTATTSHVLTESRFKGPYVHVTLDGSSNVVNAPITEEIAESKSKLKKSFTTQTTNDRNKMRGMHVSTLSMKYDASTTDKTWMCVFCKMGPHRFGLGDLFGPYLISTACEEYELSQIDPKLDAFKSKRSRIDMIQKRILPSTSAAAAAATTVTPSKSKKRKSTTEVNPTVNIVEQQQQQRSLNSPTTTQTNSQQSLNTDQIMSNMDMENIYFGMTRSSDVNYEVWLHGDCAAWSSGVYIIGSRIIGLESAVWSSTRHICTICDKNGAMLSCLERGCDSEIHVPCARNNQWNLCDENFKSYCNKHFKDTTNINGTSSATVTTMLNTNSTIVNATTNDTTTTATTNSTNNINKSTEKP